MSDLETNTRKRRRLARRYNKEEPLFGYQRLCLFIHGYKYETYLRDIKIPTGRRKRGKKLHNNRMEFHNELLSKLDLSASNNKVVTKLMLNWENRNKPMVIRLAVSETEWCTFSCPRHWPLKKIRTVFAEMVKIKPDELDAYWRAATSYGG